MFLHGQHDASEWPRLRSVLCHRFPVAELRSLVHWSGSVVAGWHEKRHEVLVALGACLQPGPGGKPSRLCAPGRLRVRRSGPVASLGPVILCSWWQVGLSHQLRKKYRGGGRRRNVSAKLGLAVTLAPLSHAIGSSLLPQFTPLLATTSRQVNQQAYAMVSHMK